MSMNPDEEDRLYRAAWGIGGKKPWGCGLRAAYYQYLPDAPKGPYVTREDARRYVLKIQEVEAMMDWTWRERDKLRAMRKLWQRRADGLDPRFDAMGVQGGTSEKYRLEHRRTKLDDLADLRKLIQESSGHAADEAETRYLADPAWPLGKPPRGLSR